MICFHRSTKVLPRVEHHIPSLLRRIATSQTAALSLRPVLSHLGPRPATASCHHNTTSAHLLQLVLRLPRGQRLCLEPLSVGTLAAPSREPVLITVAAPMAPNSWPPPSSPNRPDPVGLDQSRPSRNPHSSVSCTVASASSAVWPRSV